MAAVHVITADAQDAAMQGIAAGIMLADSLMAMISAANGEIDITLRIRNFHLLSKTGITANNVSAIINPKIENG